MRSALLLWARAKEAVAPATAAVPASFTKSRRPRAKSSGGVPSFDMRELQIRGPQRRLSHSLGRKQSTHLPDSHLQAGPLNFRCRRDQGATSAKLSLANSKAAELRMQSLSASFAH